MPISAIIEKCRARLGDPSFPEIGEWKRRHPGGKVIGSFPVYTPVEIVHAAGMLPVLIAGAPGRMKFDEADGYLQSFVCSVGRSTLELKLDGFLDELDGMIFPSTCEISRGLSGVWKRHDPAGPVFLIHFPQNLSDPGSLDYLINELDRLKKWLEGIGGSEITSDAIRDSFRQYNRRAELLNVLDYFRADRPERLSGSEFYILRLAGLTVPVDEHARILEEAIDALESTADRHPVRLRMVLSGASCERPPVSMLQAIEGEGIAIVADDMLLGQRWWREPLPEKGDPIGNLAMHYLKESAPSPLVFSPAQPSCDMLLKTVEERGADGIILSFANFCHPAIHDSACTVRLAEEHGLPYVRLSYEQDQRVFESIRVQVEALLEARERLPIAGTENGRAGRVEE